MTGRRLIDPGEEEAVVVCVMSRNAAMLRDFSELTAKMAQALADGQMTPAEATIADKAAATLEESTRDLRMSLATVISAGGVKAGLRIVGEA